MFELKKETALKIANLSPGESVVEKLVEIHPMKQVTYASIIQVLVLGFMLGSMALIQYFIV
jgi:hypothetical protein